MTDKEKIIAYIDKLLEKYPKNYYLLTVAEFIDSLQEEPVSNDFEMALAEMINKSQTSIIEPWVVAAQWKDELIKLAKSEEPVSEQNLSNVQRFGKNWKEPVSEDLEEASKEWLIPQLDKSYANYGEAKMMELTHFDGYAMLDAIEFGAKWKEEQFEKNSLKHCNSITNEQAELEQEFIDRHLDKHQRMPTFLDAIEYGMRLQKEQMMKGLCFETKVYLESDGCTEDFNESEWLDLEKTEITELPVDALGLKAGDKVMIIIVKEDRR